MPEVRDLPLALSSLLADHALKGFATLSMDVATLGQHPVLRPKLRTFSMGALLYRDVRVGAFQLPNSPLVEYLRLRAYHVDYNYKTLDNLSRVLTQIIKGTKSGVAA